VHLESLGWNSHFESCFAAHLNHGHHPGRIAGQERTRYTVCTEFGATAAEVSGRLRFEARAPADFPVVGDWVALSAATALEPAVIQAVLPRKTAFSRNAAGRVAEAQVLAANVDTVFIVAGLDHEFNPRRIERYVVAAWDSGATPVLVLNKADICPDVEAHVGQALDTAPGVPVVPVSAKEGSGLGSLTPHLSPGTTVVLLGPSGVGKSSLVNRLAQADLQVVAAVREADGKGRHTTTARELIPLPGGALLIDTPGLRELQLAADESGLDAAFDDIAALAERCRFSDCRHDQEPGCAVKQAMERGELPPSRLASFRRLQRELRRAAVRRSLREAQVERTRIKQRTRACERLSRPRAAG
jgi:ribosome biogenesis GTPase